MPHVLDRAEFGRLFAEHARLLWVVGAAFVPKAQVEDVLQDAAAVALARIGEFAPGTSFRAWMTQIVRYTAANARRRQRRQTTEDLAFEPVGEPVGGPGGETAGAEVVAHNGDLRDGQSEFDDRVLHALRDLHADARASLLLRVVMDLSYSEIAATLSLPEGTVASHVHRAREALRDRLRARPATLANAPASGELLRERVRPGRAAVPLEDPEQRLRGLR